MRRKISCSTAGGVKSHEALRLQLVSCDTNVDRRSLVKNKAVPVPDSSTDNDRRSQQQVVQGTVALEGKKEETVPIPALISLLARKRRREVVLAFLLGSLLIAAGAAIGLAFSSSLSRWAPAPEVSGLFRALYTAVELLVNEIHIFVKLVGTLIMAQLLRLSLQSASGISTHVLNGVGSLPTLVKERKVHKALVLVIVLLGPTVASIVVGKAIFLVWNRTTKAMYNRHSCFIGDYAMDSKGLWKPIEYWQERQTNLRALTISLGAALNNKCTILGGSVENLSMLGSAGGGANSTVATGVDGSSSASIETATWMIDSSRKCKVGSSITEMCVNAGHTLINRTTFRVQPNCSTLMDTELSRMCNTESFPEFERQEVKAPVNGNYTDFSSAAKEAEARQNCTKIVLQDLCYPKAVEECFESESKREWDLTLSAEEFTTSIRYRELPDREELEINYLTSDQGRNCSQPEDACPQNSRCGIAQRVDLMQSVTVYTANIRLSQTAGIRAWALQPAQLWLPGVVENSIGLFRSKNSYQFALEGSLEVAESVDTVDQLEDRDQRYERIVFSYQKQEETMRGVMNWVTFELLATEEVEKLVTELGQLATQNLRQSSASTRAGLRDTSYSQWNTSDMWDSDEQVGPTMRYFNFTAACEDTARWGSDQGACEAAIKAELLKVQTVFTGDDYEDSNLCGCQLALEDGSSTPLLDELSKYLSNDLSEATPLESVGRGLRGKLVDNLSSWRDRLVPFGTPTNYPDECILPSSPSVIGMQSFDYEQMTGEAMFTWDLQCVSIRPARGRELTVHGDFDFDSEDHSCIPELRPDCSCEVSRSLNYSYAKIGAQVLGCTSQMSGAYVAVNYSMQATALYQMSIGYMEALSPACPEVPVKEGTARCNVELQPYQPRNDNQSFVVLGTMKTTAKIGAPNSVSKAHTVSGTREVNGEQWYHIFYLENDGNWTAVTELGAEELEMEDFHLATVRFQGETRMWMNANRTLNICAANKSSDASQMCSSLIAAPSKKECSPLIVDSLGYVQSDEYIDSEIAANITKSRQELLEISNMLDTDCPEAPWFWPLGLFLFMAGVFCVATAISIATGADMLGKIDVATVMRRMEPSLLSGGSNGVVRPVILAERVKLQVSRAPTAKQVPGDIAAGDRETIASTAGQDNGELPGYWVSKDKKLLIG